MFVLSDWCLVSCHDISKHRIQYLVWQVSVLLCQVFDRHLPPARALFLMSAMEDQASIEGAPFQLGYEERWTDASLTPDTAVLLSALILNSTAPVAERHFSCFSEQISGIIPLLLLPAELSCSFSLHLVKRDQVFVPTISNWTPDPCWACSLSV